MFKNINIFYYLIYVFTDDGYLTPWSTWLCDVSCGIGTTKRTRQCLPEDPDNYNSECPLSCDDAILEESEECDMGPCK